MKLRPQNIMTDKATSYKSDRREKYNKNKAQVRVFKRKNAVHTKSSNNPPVLDILDNLEILQRLSGGNQDA